jgi:adenylate cyclase
MAPLVERRLAAILAADVVGYSRLIEANEAGTLRALRAMRQEVLKPLLSEHHGRVVKLMGDGILVEFGSVVSAIACAAALQARIAAAQGDVAPERGIVLRIGVHLGDVVVEGEDLLGDGMNVAARLEQLCPPGGVLISAAAYDQLPGKLDLTFEDAGEHHLKNIARPVRAYRLAPEGAPSRLSLAPQTGEKPAVAVLPFKNMSGDPKQDYFADGMTEDIITDLSKVSALSVVALSTYKGKLADVQEVSRRFNVAHILEGSVRRAGGRVRINAQLIDGRDVTHLWADRYDRDLTDIFAIQDEITRTIVEQLKVKLLPQEKKAIEAAPTQNIEAYNYYLRGRHLCRLHTQQHVLLGQRMFRKAVELDPGYARAHAGLADCARFLYIDQHNGTSVKDILKASTKALELDPDLAEAHVAHGMALHFSSRSQEAIAEFERAIALDPNLFEAFYNYTEVLVDIGDREKAVLMYERAADIAPDDFRCPFMLAQMYEDLGRHQESQAAARIGLERAEHALAAHPDVALPAAQGAVTLARLGDRTRALEWVSRALTIAPDDPLTLYNVACTYSVLGEADLALDLIERWSARAPAKRKRQAADDTDFASIRDYPRYRKLFESIE